MDINPEGIDLPGSHALGRIHLIPFRYKKFIEKTPLVSKPFGKCS
jgi:hypothetical protein